VPAEILVQIVAQLLLELGGRAALESAVSKGHAHFDRRAFASLDDDARQAMIAGLVFVAAHDGVLSRLELDEIHKRVKRLGVDELGEDFDLAMAARTEVGDAAGQDDEAYAGQIMNRIPSERVQKALIRIGITIASKGDFGRQRAALELLADAAGWERHKLEALIQSEQQKLIR